MAINIQTNISSLEAQGRLAVGVAEGEYVGCQTAASRADYSGEGVRDDDAFLAAHAQAGFAKRGDFHWPDCRSGWPAARQTRGT